MLTCRCSQFSGTAPILICSGAASDCQQGHTPCSLEGLAVDVAVGNALCDIVVALRALLCPLDIGSVLVCLLLLALRHLPANRKAKGLDVCCIPSRSQDKDICPYTICLGALSERGLLLFALCSLPAIKGYCQFLTRLFAIHWVMLVL